MSPGLFGNFSAKTRISPRALDRHKIAAWHFGRPAVDLRGAARRAAEFGRPVERSENQGVIPQTLRVGPDYAVHHFDPSQPGAISRAQAGPAIPMFVRPSPP